MFKKKSILLAAILSCSAMLTGCDSGGGSSSGGASPAPSGRDTSGISVSSQTELLNHERQDMYGNKLCKNTMSKFATADFVIGTNDAISDAKLKDMIKSIQLSFDIQTLALNVNKTMPLNNGGLGLDPNNKLEICVATSEGNDGAGDAGGIIVGTGRSGADFDTLVDHELVHTITDILAGNPSITAYGHRWVNEGIAEMFSGDAKLTKSQMSGLISDVNGSPMPNPAEVVHKGDEDMWLFSGKNPTLFYPAYNTTLSFLEDWQGLYIHDIVDIYRNMRVLENACHKSMIDLYADYPSLARSINVYNPSEYPIGATACLYEFDQHDSTYSKYMPVNPLPGSRGEIVSRDNMAELAINSVLSGSGLGSYDNLRDNYESLIVNGYLN